MELFRWIGLCAVALLPVQLLRRKTPELALVLTLAALLVALTRVLSVLAPLLEQLRLLFDRAGVDGGHVDILLKTVAAASVTRLGADLCRDGGSQALGSAVELTGTAAVMTVLLPLLQEVTEMLLGLWNGGGIG